MNKVILSKLKKIEREYNVQIIWAIESGSRAWGFTSKDSDYDVRCMHIGKEQDYLGLFPPPKQINLMEDNIDIESWDIKKFSELTLRSNPQIAEWLRSDIVYINSPIRRGFRKIFDEGCSLDYLKYHYLRMAKQNYYKYIRNELVHNCKKYLYVLRALACAKFIEKEGRLPPLPYKNVIHYLPKNIQKFFIRCVIEKNTTENAKIISDKIILKFIESNVNKNIPKKEFDFKKTLSLNKYLVKIISSQKN
jgi:predicted nucleotidyltransferase